MKRIDAQDSHFSFKIIHSNQKMKLIWIEHHEQKNKKSEKETEEKTKNLREKSLTIRFNFPMFS